MIYKLSNTLDVTAIENEFNIPFKFPRLYEPKAIINGLEESNLPTILCEDSSKIHYAIWGLLPDGYDDDWDSFQSVTNTLNINIDDKKLDRGIYAGSLEQRRCLIVVNGFISSYMKSGKLYHYYLHLKNYLPFCIAGVYNKTCDGFYTFSLLVCDAVKKIDGIPNLYGANPLIIRKEDHHIWLNQTSNLATLTELLKNYSSYHLQKKPINLIHFEQHSDLESSIHAANYKFKLKIS